MRMRDTHSFPVQPPEHNGNDWDKKHVCSGTTQFHSDSQLGSGDTNSVTHTQKVTGAGPHRALPQHPLYLLSPRLSTGAITILTPGDGNKALPEPLLIHIHAVSKCLRCKAPGSLPTADVWDETSCTTPITCWSTALPITVWQTRPGRTGPQEGRSSLILRTPTPPSPPLFTP